MYHINIIKKSINDHILQYFSFGEPYQLLSKSPKKLVLISLNLYKLKCEYSFFNFIFYFILFEIKYKRILCKYL